MNDLPGTAKKENKKRNLLHEGYHNFDFLRHETTLIQNPFLKYFINFI